ncbi:glucosaminidase domain-containing protein [Salinicoccus sp. HZC-1]|uniref:glucosaminidase domain-containing protein n=1 Tax=Salinicoccus sp. HZC-1 TaxID=3385497 RepID=UPI00398AB0D7
MKYKNRLIVPTVVTLSLLGLNGEVNAEEKHVDSPSLETTTEENISIPDKSAENNDVQGNIQPAITNELEDKRNQITEPGNETHDKKVHNSGNQNETKDNTSNKTSENASTPEIKGASQAKDYTVTESNSTSIDQTQTKYKNEKENSEQNEDADILTEDVVADDNNVIDINEDKSLNQTQNNQEQKHASTEAYKLSNEKDSTEDNIIQERGNTRTTTELKASERGKDKNTSSKHAEEASVEKSSERDDVQKFEIYNKKDIQKLSRANKKSTDEKTAEKTEDNEADIAQDDETSEKIQLDSVSSNENTGEIKDNDEELKETSFATFATMAKEPADIHPQYSNASFAAKLRSQNNSGLRSPVFKPDSVSANFLLDQTIFIEEQAEYAGELFYKVHSSYDGAMQGWMKESDLNTWNLSDSKTHKENFKVSSTQSYLLTDPWGTEKQQIKKLSEYGDKTFSATKMLTLGSHTYYYGKLGNDYGWLEERKMHSLDEAPVYSEASFAAKLRSSNNSGLRSPVFKPDSVSANFLLDKTIFIEEQAEYAGELFYKVHSSYDGAMQGWMKEADLNTWNLSDSKAHKEDFRVNSTQSYLLTDPWGTEKQHIKKLGTYENDTFQTTKMLTLGSHTYYYGKLGNDYGWLEKRKLEEYTPVAPSPSVKTVRYNQSFNQVLNTQMNLSSKPQAWANGGGWRNATRSEVASFLDTSHQTSETWMYTFLDLDRSQNIASSTLNNRLLSGKGTLSNQGSAFLNAANTQGINEVYLISHAIHETGNGTSTLAQGVRLDSNGNISSNGKKYYNMYGVAAYDYNPVLAGARYAQQMGWDTPAKAIIGGARFISQNYFNRGQTTLYSMRWNPLNPGTYQYATDVNWAYATARNLQNYYNQLDIKGRYYTKHIF